MDIKELLKHCGYANLNNYDTKTRTYHIPKYTKPKLNNPNMKEHFFQDIDEEAKAYFLGLLISDGNVFKDDTGR